MNALELGEMTPKLQDWSSERRSSVHGGLGEAWPRMVAGQIGAAVGGNFNFIEITLCNGSGSSETGAALDLHYLVVR